MTSTAAERMELFEKSKDAVHRAFQNEVRKDVEDIPIMWVIDPRDPEGFRIAMTAIMAKEGRTAKNVTADLRRRIVQSERKKSSPAIVFAFPQKLSVKLAGNVSKYGAAAHRNQPPMGCFHVVVLMPGGVSFIIVKA